MAADEIVIPTKERLGSYDAIETAKPGEPLFPLQGGDPFGPPTVLHWVKLCREEGLRLTSEHPEGSKEHKRGERLLGKATDAEQVAWAMQAYQRGELAASGGRTAHDEADDEADHTEEVKHERGVLIKASGLLHNHLAGVKEVAEMLRLLGRHLVEASRLEDMVHELQGIAYTIEPRRGNERS
jgi:hypothetical protein